MAGFMGGDEMEGEIELVKEWEGGIPPMVDGETVEEYHQFLRYAMMPPGRRTAMEVAKELGMSVEELTELSLRRWWVDRVRRFDRERLEQLRVASATAMQEALEEMLLAVRSVAERVRAVAPSIDIGAHNVAQLMTAMGELVKAMQAISDSGGGGGGGGQVSLRDVITIVTGATQARMVHGPTGVEVITDDGGE